MQYNVVFSIEAEDDAGSILAYITQASSLDAAKRFTDALIVSVRSFQAFLTEVQHTMRSCPVFERSAFDEG